MKKVVIISTLVLIILSAGISALGQQDRFSPEGLGFSIIPPSGWTIGENDKGQPRLWGPATSEFTANMNGRLHNTRPELKLKEFVTAAVEYLLAHTDQLGTDSTVLRSKAEFASTSGIPGYKVVLVSKRAGLTIRSTQYTFAKGGVGDKYLLTYTTLDSDSATNATLDASARSLLLLK